LVNEISLYYDARSEKKHQKMHCMFPALTAARLVGIGGFLIRYSNDHTKYINCQLKTFCDYYQQNILI